MNLSVGIVGLPNVGKSTLFNALLKKQQALVADYPFTTIEPNVGVVPVPDENLEKIAKIVGAEIARQTHVENDARSSFSQKQNLPRSLSESLFKNKNLKSSKDQTPFSSFSNGLPSLTPPIVPSTVKFIDIAGLVKGAHEGEGLGNKFLSHIREVSAIAHIVKLFNDQDQKKVLEDYEIIKLELELGGIEGKPEIIVLNVAENEYKIDTIQKLCSDYMRIFNLDRDDIVVISAKIDSELSGLSDREQKEYLSSLGLPYSGLERLIKKAYEMLNLISFYTTKGGKEVHSWPIKRGTKAIEAAGEIHTDFSKNFIKAEVISCEDFIKIEGWKEAREAGKTRLEGKDYIVKDGDVIEFKIGS